MTDEDTSKTISFLANLVKLTLSHNKKIDKKIAEVGEYGEVHIIIERGKLKYINKVQSDKFEEQGEDEE